MRELETANVGTDHDQQVFPAERLDVLESAAILGPSGGSCPSVCLFHNLPSGAQSQGGLPLDKALTLAPEAMLAL